MCTPACSSYHGFLVNRFSLGFIEAGVSPTFMLVVGLWYTKQEQVLRSAWWYSFGGGTNLISPLINYGLGHIAGGGLHPWQYMYFIAGVMTFVWGIALWWIFPGTPEHGRGFSAEERMLLQERVRRNNAGAENHVSSGTRPEKPCCNRSFGLSSFFQSVLPQAPERSRPWHLCLCWHGLHNLYVSAVEFANRCSGFHMYSWIGVYWRQGSSCSPAYTSRSVRSCHFRLGLDVSSSRPTTEAC